MKPTVKLVRQVTSELFGEEVTKLTDLLYGKKDVSEFVLSKKLKMDVNSVRNMLYKLHNENMVSFTKKKDYEKGWYVYYWTLNSKRTVEMVDVIKDKRIEFLRTRLRREKDHLFYICCNNCARFDFEKATDFEFKCPECSSILIEQDNSKTIMHIETELKKLEANA